MAESILAKMAVVLDAVTAGFNKSIAGAEKTLSGFASSATSAGSLISGALAGVGVLAIGKEIIDVTSEFQKFGAVLKNTLGSDSAANIAMRDIQTFAAKTPFAVDELTSSFVKLANQGFSPTTEEMRKLGDLAASTGKGFDQLAEAIIDAQTGEFERLKEFGVRASKAGDKVSFTFKGIKTQTDFTAKAMREYILSLGDAQGVSGAMAGISETLGGKISNLGDNWTQLLKTIGDGNKGPLTGAISLLSDAIAWTTEFAKTRKQLQEEAETAGQSGIIEELKANIALTQDLDGESQALIKTLDEEAYAIAYEAKQFSASTEEGYAHLVMLSNQTKVLDAQIQAINDYVKAIKEKAAAEEEARKKDEASLGIIGKLEKEIKKLEEQKKAAFSTGAIENFNVQIDALKEKLATLNASHPLTKFGKDLKNDFIANGVNQLPEFDLKFKKPDVSELFPTTAQIQPPDFSAVQYAFATIQKGYVETGVIAEQSLGEMTAQIQKTGSATADTAKSSALAWDQQIAKQMAAADAAAEYGSIVGDALGQAITGQMSFADAAKKVTAELLKTFLARALGGIIASAATSGGPPPVAIALAAAGVAAISAMFSKIGGPSKSVAGSVAKPSAPPQGRREYKGMGDDIRFDAKFVIEGDKLTAVAKTDEYQKQRLG